VKQSGTGEVARLFSPCEAGGVPGVAGGVRETAGSSTTEHLDPSSGQAHTELMVSEPARLSLYVRLEEVLGGVFAR